MRIKETVKKGNAVLKYFLIGLVYLYRLFISTLFGPKCRFQPTCSAYAVQALHVHGVKSGLALTIRRVLSCHPYSKKSTSQGTYDPVPEKTNT